ncbi:hypothetical protein MYCTH_2111026 [Thermothelomyces thermophilus ATCC 42464]|uniref:Uncharacterized protein n=1 Tax=Thermothelomyces thermophilus (strain ATCC 42464 / BCRC 31852 / DSM 1799) TaxID=573729 RepID=G2QH97_THET4|nr:uncharacterized protein MYCTH_2111026 [Thermothelomyces thermophilus ATCC 42464]AEO58757.1 hypothetical protein MYCTH_2111026 [Thermothelomyces thermophilus ATCC 42464]
MVTLGSFCRRPLDRVRSNAPDNGSTLEGHGASDLDGTITAHDPSDLTHHAGPVGQQAESLPDETASWPRSRPDATDLHLTFESNTRHEGDLAASGIAALESPRAGDHSEAGYRCPSKCACTEFYYDADDERDEEDEDGDDDEDEVYDQPAVVIIHQGASGAIPLSSRPALLHNPNNALIFASFASRHDSPASSTLRAWFDLPSPGASACATPSVVAASRDEEVRIGIDDDDASASSTADDRSALTYYTDTAYGDYDDNDNDDDEEHVFRWRGDLVTAAELADAAAVVELELEMGLLADGLARRLLQGSSSGGGDSSWSLSSWSLSGGFDESQSGGSGSSDADSVWDADG